MEESQYAELAIKLEGWLEGKFPERSEQRVSGLLAPDAGASNETILFDLNWLEKGTRHSCGLVVRLEPLGEGIFPDYDLPLQFHTMQRLQKTDVNVPAVLALETNLDTLGRPFYLMERLDGRYLADNPPYQMEGWLTEETAAIRGAMWRNAITNIAAVNRVDWQQLGFADLWDADNFNTPLAQLLDYYARFLDWAESRGRPFAKLHPVLEYLRENQPGNDPIALCWGDAKPPNLMLSKEGGDIVGLLDWEMVHLGNPVHDLCWWIVLDNSLTTGLGLPKLDGLPSRSEMIALWEQSSGFSAEALDYYELLSNFQFAVIMHRVGTRLTAQGIFQPEDEFDIKNNSTLLIDEQIAKFGIAKRL